MRKSDLFRSDRVRRARPERRWHDETIYCRSGWRSCFSCDDQQRGGCGEPVLDQRAVVGGGADGGNLPRSARQKAARAFAHGFCIAEAAGFAGTDSVYVDVAIIDLADVKDVNALFAELFARGSRPARTIYQAARLPFDGCIKVQAVAARCACRFRIETPKPAAPPWHLDAPFAMHAPPAPSSTPSRFAIRPAPLTTRSASMALYLPLTAILTRRPSPVGSMCLTKAWGRMRLLSRRT